MEEAIQMPYVAYFEMVYRLEEDVYGFEHFNDDMKLNRYGEILEIMFFRKKLLLYKEIPENILVKGQFNTAIGNEGISY